MTAWQALLLGFIQGVTEFLPVSSSGHLVIFQQYLNFSEPPVFFDILLHLSTLLAVIIYFRKKILMLIKPEYTRLLVATIPILIVGFVLSPYEKVLFSSLPLVTFGLFVTGSILLLTTKIKPENQVFSSFPLIKALAVGMAQACAIVPGISRSGATISTGLILGLKRSEAVAFSFILSIPAIIAASIFASLKELSAISTPPTLVLIGCVTAFITGLFALKLLDRIVSQAKVHYFGYYCYFLALMLIILN